MQCVGPWLLFVGHCSLPASVEEEESKSEVTVATRTGAESGEQPWPVVATPVQKKSQTKSVCFVKHEEEAGPSPQQEEAGLQVITQFPPLGEPQDIGKDFSDRTGEALLDCLPQC